MQDLNQLWKSTNFFLISSASEITIIEQVHRITDVIQNGFKHKKLYTEVFFDIAQAFNKVWHQGLILKIDYLLLEQDYYLLISYVAE